MSEGICENLSLSLPPDTGFGLITSSLASWLELENLSSDTYRFWGPTFPQDMVPSIIIPGLSNPMWVLSVFKRFLRFLALHREASGVPKRSSHGNDMICCRNSGFASPQSFRCIFLCIFQISQTSSGSSGSRVLTLGKLGTFPSSRVCRHLGAASLHKIECIESNTF